MENDVNLFNKIVGIITIIIYAYVLFVVYSVTFEIISTNGENYGALAGAFLLVIWIMFSIISVVLVLLTKLWKQIEIIVYILDIEIILGIIFTLFFMFAYLRVDLSNGILTVIPGLLVIFIPHIINGILAYKGFMNLKNNNFK